MPFLVCHKRNGWKPFGLISIQLMGLAIRSAETHINSCDFSLENYAYNDTPGDVNLEQFDISRDKGLLIPLIRDATAVRGEDIRLLASPWSPPAWMKTNGQMNRGGALKREYYDTWALYFVKYIQAYAAEGVPNLGCIDTERTRCKTTLGFLYLVRRG